MTRNRPMLALALTAAVFAAGCYESDVPLDPSPPAAVDTALVGTWRCLPLDADADESPATVVVAADNARQYQVAWREGDKAPERYRAYFSTLPVPRLLNVQSLQEGKTEKTWSFMRYSFLRPGVVELQAVRNEALKGVAKSPAALRQAIEQRRNRPDLFVDFCVCVRAKEAK